MAEINLADNFPALRLTGNVTQTWTSGSLTTTISDKNIRPYNTIRVMPLSPPVGHWGFAVTEGQCVITSTDLEPNMTFKYRIE